MDINIADSVRGSSYRQWLLAILANTSMFTYGLQCGWIAVFAKSLQSEQSPTGFALSDSEISWLASAPSLSATITVGIYTYLADKYGRRKCIILVALFQAVTWIIKLCPANTSSLIIARVSCGIAGGGCLNIVPMYIKEISHDSLRGTLGSILITAQNTGILIMFILGGYLPYNTVLWIVVGIPFLTMIGMLRASESPSFLVKIGKYDEAIIAIAYLRGRSTNDKLVHHEIEAIKSEDERFKSLPNITYVRIFNHNAWCRGFIIMIAIIICHGTNGNFSIISYASIVLAQIGVNISPELQSMAIPAFLIIGSLLSMICVDRLGRKIIICSSFMACGVLFLLLVAIVLSGQFGVWLPSWLPTVVIVLSVSAYAFGVMPMPFVIMSEMFNFQIRAKVMGVLVTLAWLSCSVQLLLYNTIVNAYGAHLPFFCFAIINFCGAFIVLLHLPETKGKTVEEIELELAKRVNTK